MDQSGPRLRIDHVMVPVADIQRSIAFYDDAFGMQVVVQREDKKRLFAHVGYGPRSEHVTIELVQETGVAPVAGGRHVCICLPDLNAWILRMEAAGRQFARAHGMRDGQIMRAWILDPDGHLLEVSGSRS